MDMMMKIYDALIADEYISEKTSFFNTKGEKQHRIKFYEYPESATISQPFIIIDPLGPPLETDYGDDEAIAEEYLYQLDVWTKDRKTTKELARRVKKSLRAAGFYYYSGGVDEYDRETKIYRDARRFRGKLYIKDVEALA